MTLSSSGRLCAVALLSTACTAALAADGVVTVRPATPAMRALLNGSSASTDASARAIRDKETGQLRAPDAGELKEILKAERDARVARGLPADPVAAPVSVRQYPNGMTRATLGEEYMVNLKAQRDASGRLVISHDRAEHEHRQAAPAADR